MHLDHPSVFILVGAVGGFASGILGIGGGVILVPLLVFLLGITQHTAQGTTLAMFCLPGGLAAALQYHQKGFVDWKIALLLFCGFLIGGHLGGQLATAASARILQRLFGLALIGFGAKMMLTR